MAHIVGVPKREPCQKCSLPVFLAERLTVGKKVYHRTCLKCARCNSQLTPGSFYETEVDGEYCCETCPDEEKKLDMANTSTENRKDDGLNRMSIADRLAFFENDGKKLLQKSLSDEEKSQSLKTINGSQPHNIYKTNTALNNFMNSHFSDCVDSSSHNNSRRSSSSSTSSISSSATENISEELPELPKSLPPSLDTDISDAQSSLQQETSAESSLVHNNSSVNLRTEEVDSQQSRALQDNHLQQEEPSLETISDKVEQTDNSAPTIISSSNNTPIQNDLNVSINVTKDSSENDEEMRPIEEPSSIDSCKDPASDINSTGDNNNTANRTSMVRARLHQFEVIANKTHDSSINSVNKNRISNLSKKKKRMSIDESEKSLEIEVPKQASKDDETNTDSLKVSSSIEGLANDETKSASCHDLNENREIPIECEEIPIKIESETENNPPKEIEIEKSDRIKSSESTDSLNRRVSAIPEEVKEALNESKSEIIDPCIHVEDETIKEEKKIADIVPSTMTPSCRVLKPDDYPEELNPFKSDDDNDDEGDREQNLVTNSVNFKYKNQEKRKSLNPFESSDEECEPEKKLKPPRPPPPKKVSTNPFGSESEDEEESQTISTASISSSTPKRTPIPTPRTGKSTSQNVTPEPTPRASRQSYGSPLKNSSDYYGSDTSLTHQGITGKFGNDSFSRENDGRASGRSIASSISSPAGTIRTRKGKKAPPPPPPVSKVAKELSPSESDSKRSSPTSSIPTTPTPRKKRPAPAPPSATKSAVEESELSTLRPQTPLSEISTSSTPPATEKSVETISTEKLSDEEKVLVEKDTSKDEVKQIYSNITDDSLEDVNSGTVKRRLIALDSSLVEDANSSTDLKIKEEENVVYRRTLIPPALDDSTQSPVSPENESHDRQLEKLKDNKEAKNRNRQSQISLPSEENDPLYNKSVHGKWKRRKGPAPALPVPPKKVLQMLPLQEIRHELEIIEVQQQGLEKQGVMLEKMIRERCEGPPGDDTTDSNYNSSPNSKEVEDLILQLFELVNEKNELFRRQAELMYLRRQHRLEQEQADLEYEIRVLMAQPERNKTDSDKAREEALIARLVEVVQLRNEVVECLEMDRLREAEEDMSIKQRLEMHTAKRDEELSKQTPTKLSKKEKKKQKELKKLGKSKKLDADKDADESELSVEKQKIKKKKKKFLF